MRETLAELETERAVHKERAQEVLDQLRAQDAIIERTDAVLFGSRPPHWQEEKPAKEERSAAMLKRSELKGTLHELQRLDSGIGLRVAALQTAIRKAEYTSVSLADLQALSREIVANIRSAAARLTELAANRSCLMQKRAEAESAIEAVADARDELGSAREAVEKQRGEAFMSGRAIDLAPYIARVAKAEKRHTTAEDNAAAGRAALPRIASGLKAIEEEQATLEDDGKAYRAAWFANRTRQEEIGYRASAHALMDSTRLLVALDPLTRSGLGRGLLDEVRNGFPMPINGKYVEKLDTAPWFGTSDLPDVSGAVEQLEAEFDAALSDDGPLQAI